MPPLKAALLACGTAAVRPASAFFAAAVRFGAAAWFGSSSVRSRKTSTSQRASISRRVPSRAAMSLRSLKSTAWVLS